MNVYTVLLIGGESGEIMINSERMLSFLEQNQLDALWIQKDENVRYISGFSGADSYLFLTQEQSYLVTDSRYIGQASEECPAFTIVDYHGKLPQELSTLAVKHNVRRFGIESILTYKMYLDLAGAMAGVQFVFCEPDTLRQIKTEEELSYIAEACRISDEGFKKTVPFIRPGRTEKELRGILECAMMEAGADGKSFDTIVASGLHSAYPHATPTDKPIAEGELITFDFGATYKGYHSDITRTVAVGTISDRLRFMYDSIYDCVAYIESMLKPGLKACDVDQESRSFLKKRELASYFTHALGHAVGLEIHETPVLAPRDKTVLQKNMVETVEPGVYIPGVGGVRIEDTVVLTGNGNKPLTQYSKEFLKV
ncbi:MAG: aminopeptidase P family protein [Dialister sp.]|nr:aminopeptidase P family protein [Dialister sp.]